jgi:protein SCO1
LKHVAVALFLAIAVCATGDERPAAKYFRDITLVDHNGRSVDLYNDLMSGRTVVINTFFASCTGSCPVMAHTLGAMQTRFADRLGKDLVLISITVDPENDTPAKLNEYAKRVGAKEGWYFLSGSTQQVDYALNKIGQVTQQREGHMNIFVIGNDVTGLWKKGLALAKADDLVALVRSVLDDGKR